MSSEATPMVHGRTLSITLVVVGLAILLEAQAPASSAIDASAPSRRASLDGRPMGCGSGSPCSPTAWARSFRVDTRLRRALADTESAGKPPAPWSSQRCDADAA